MTLCSYNVVHNVIVVVPYISRKQPMDSVLETRDGRIVVVGHHYVLEWNPRLLLPSGSDRPWLARGARALPPALFHRCTGDDTLDISSRVSHLFARRPPRQDTHSAPSPLSSRGDSTHIQCAGGLHRHGDTPSSASQTSRLHPIPRIRL